MPNMFSPVGFECILKWFRDPHKPNNIISKTLGKYCYVDQRYEGDIPALGSLWTCRITHESNPTQKRGAFLVEPLREVSKNSEGHYDIAKLMPGFFTREDHGDIVILRADPSLGSKNWIVPLSFRRSLPNRIYAVLAPLNEP